MSKKNVVGLILLIAVMAIALWLRYTAIFESPNQYLNLYGDGFKNYATVIHHVKHDSTYLWYEGMNYPWGEHLVFADGQPLLANSIKFISQNISDISEHTVAIINLSMLFSMLLAAILLYILFAKLGVVWWYNILVSGSLVMMARQTEKITAHYGLSHVFVVPLILLLLYQFEKKPTYWLSLIIGLTIFLVAQLHFYFFGISIFLIAFYGLSRLIQAFSWERVFFYFKHYLLQIILPFGLLQWLLSVGNHVVDRSDSPTGFLKYRTRWEGVFTHKDYPLWEWGDETFGIRDIPNEGISYVGLVATVFFLVILIRWLGITFTKLLKFSKRKRDLQLPKLLPDVRERDRNYISALCFSAFSLLILAHAFPFSISGLENLLHYAGPYKQFRGVGRFTWAFYFGFNVVVFYSLWWWSRKEKIGGISKIPPIYRRISLFIALCVMFYEAHHFTTLKTVNPRTRAELAPDFTKQPDSWLRYVDLNRYQAVLPLPYFHIGSENFNFDAPGHLHRFSSIPGFQNGIPSLGVMMSRTSLSQTFKSLQLALEPYRYPTIIDEFKSDKPLLIVEDKEYSEKWKDRFPYLKEGATLLQEDEKNAAVYELPLSAFEERIEQRKQAIIQELADTTLIEKYSYLLNQDAEFIHQSFDNQYNSLPYFGSGGGSGDINETVTLYEGTLPNQARKQILSFWLKGNQDQMPRTIVSIKEMDAQRGKQIKEHRLSFRFEVKAIDGDWLLFERKMDFSQGDIKIKIELEHNTLPSGTWYFDELFMRPVGVDVYQQVEDYVWKNNRWFPQ
ncbi:MAG: hypothetical protein AB8G22_20300 [Saprospiraceae bacterium]